MTLCNCLSEFVEVSTSTFLLFMDVRPLGNQVDVVWQILSCGEPSGCCFGGCPSVANSKAEGQ